MASQNDSHGFLPLSELEKMPQLPVNFRVDDLIRYGTPRPTLFCGRPESGKSTTARQLCLSVASGTQFLGRDTKQCEVAWYGTEDSPADLVRLFRLAGYDSTRHKPIHILVDQQRDPLTSLHDFLVEHVDVGLCIIEPLDSMLKIKDIKDNSAAREAFDRLHSLVLHDLYERVSFVGLVQLKKRDVDESGLGILGATELRARSDSKLFLKRVSDADPRRVVSATVREGREILPSFLNYDAETRTSTLGTTVAAEHREKNLANQENLDEGLVEFLAAHPNSKEEEILEGVHGKSDDIRDLLKQKRKSGLIVRSGCGKSGSPFRFTLHELETDERLAA